MLNNNSDNSLCTAALRYAAKGKPVLPCRPADKAPLTRRGFYDATTERSTIIEWWNQWPNALLALPTGSRSDLLVIDLDVKNSADGIANFARLADGLEMPPHPVIRTRSGGVHHYFASVPSRVVKCSAGRIGNGIDVRGGGGYVITPPSPGYTLLDRGTKTLPPPPAWLLDLIDPPKIINPAREHADALFSVDRTMAGLIRLVGQAAENTRNSKLFWAACRAGELVASGRIGGAAVNAMLIESACYAGLTREEAEKTTASGMRHGMGGGNHV